MARRLTRKELLKQDEVQEVAFEIGHWFEENWKKVVQGAVALIVVGAAIGGWFWNSQRNRAQAESLLAEGKRQFEIAAQSDFTSDDELSSALYAFEEVIEHSADSEPGQVALYYKGSTLHRLGRLDEAIECVEQVASRTGNPSTLRGVADALLANLYVEAGRLDDAATLLSPLTETTDPGDHPMPASLALLQLGRVYREQGNLLEARSQWQRIVDEYPESAAAREARQLLGPES